MKNEPADDVSGSSGSSTMPLPRRSSRTASRTVGQRRAGAHLDAERARELGVADRRDRVARARSAKVTREDEPAARVALERARAVAERRSPRARASQTSPVAAIEHADGDDRLGDLLPVGADVLDRRGAHRPGDAGQSTRRRRARASTQRATRSSHGSPAATLDARRPVARRRRAWRRGRPCPSKPASATTTLLPPGEQRATAPAASERAPRRRARPRSSPRRAAPAGPPRRSVVSSERSTAATIWPRRGRSPGRGVEGPRGCAPQAPARRCPARPPAPSPPSPASSS